MNHAIEKQLNEKIDVCEVCNMPLPDLAKAVVHEFMGEMYTFCSKAHLEEYLKDPEKFADLENDEDD